MVMYKAVVSTDGRFALTFSKHYSAEGIDNDEGVVYYSSYHFSLYEINKQDFTVTLKDSISSTSFDDFVIFITRGIT
jgi:hypothetical protein